MVKIAHLDVAFSEMFQLEASPVEGQALQRKVEKRRKRKGETEKPNDIGHFLVQNFQI